MITIIHGENTGQSRNKLVELINQAKAKQATVTRLEAKNLDQATLEENLLSTGLFTSDKLLVIEGLHSLPRSKRKNALITMLSENGAASSDDSLIICLWEKRDLTKTMLKKFLQAQIFHFKLSNSLFTWLDAINPHARNPAQQIKILQTAIKDNDGWICLAMLARQVRLLIQAREGAKIAGPPFMISKLKRQAQNFNLKQLLGIHNRLLQIDIAHKSSKNYLNLAQDLKLLNLNICQS